MRYLILISLLLCSSCIQIGSPPPHMNYYLLESIVNTPITYSGCNLNIQMKLIGFPEYIDRLQIVTHNGNNGINFKDSERWAEPVQDNLVRVVRENLTQIIPGSAISAGPWESSSSNAVKIELAFNHFSGQLGDHTQIDIRWKINKGPEQIEQGHFTERQPIGDEYQDLIIGLNNGINNLSLELAKHLAAK